MEYIIEKTQKVKKLSDDEKTTIAKKIVDDFETYDRGRSAQLEKAKKIMNEIFFRSEVKYEKQDEQWKAETKLYKLFMYYQILKSFIWKNTYSTPNSMFNVSGESQESDADSNKQKTSLVDIFEKMDFANTSSKIIDYSLFYGDIISFCTWKKQSEEYRRPISFFEGIKDPAKLPKIMDAASKGKKFYTDERVVYDNAYVYTVDPANFVFDTTQFDRNWETCAKINRTWRTPDDIINNQNFELTKDMIDDIKSMVKFGSSESDLSDQKASSIKEEHINGSTIEMLEHWGDLTLSDGTVLKNWYAVVIGGKYLVEFEKNPLIINPFTYGCYVQDEETKRGVPLLYSIYKLALTQEDMLRRTMDMQALSENPPVYAGKGFFGKNPADLKLKPGKVIEYDNKLYTNIPVEQMSFNVAVFQEDLSYIDDLMSEISGIFPNMAGASESDRTTATEISTKVEGQLTRLKMLLDVITQTYILPVVKKIAKLKANFTFGDETIFINNENQPQDVTITDRIRQADYRYTYSDKNASAEHLNFIDMIAQVLQMFLKSGAPLNITECFTWYMEQKGVENPERFLINQEMIDPQVQQALLQNPQLAPIIEQMTQQVNAMKQGKQIDNSGDGETTVQEPAADEGLQNPSDGLQGRNLMNR